MLKNWYKQTRHIVETLFGNDADLFCNILAATSPRSSIRKNWNYATRIYKQYKANKGINFVGMLPAVKSNVKRALAGEFLSGQKVSRFAANLRGDMNVVTIDVWMCRYFGIDPVKLTPKLYRGLERIIKAGAVEAGLTPAEYQARCWQESIVESGRKPISFVAAARDELQFKLWKE